MEKSSELSIIVKLFAANENVNKEVFTKLYQRVTLGLPTRLVFDEYGVSVDVKGWDDDVILHAGPFQMQLGGHGE